MDHSQYRALAGSPSEQDKTVSTTIITLTVPAEAARAICICRDANIIYTLNGIAPVASDVSSGHQMTANATILYLFGTEMNTAQFIRATATNAKLHVRYERKLV